MPWSTNIKPGHPVDRKSDVDELISVLLPVFNGEFFLADCLYSILNQSYPHFEVIAVNDGSTDSSMAVISRFVSLDSRIRSFSLSTNRGIVAALNFGLTRCRGKWIARMDADDWMDPYRLELQLEHALEHPEVDLWGCRIELFSHQGTLSPGQIRYQDWSNALITNQEIKANIYAESPIMHPTFFLKREFCESMKGYRDHPWPEDYDFILHADRKGAVFGKLPEILLKKGDHPTRLARTDFRCKRKAMFQAKAHYFSLKPEICEKRSIVIAGTGSAGRDTYKALTEKGVPIHGFVDNIESDSNRKVMGIPVYTLSIDTADHFFAKRRDTLFLLCIGVEEGRLIVEDLFKKQGLEQGRDYFRFI